MIVIDELFGGLKQSNLLCNVIALQKKYPRCMQLIDKKKVSMWPNLICFFFT